MNQELDNKIEALNMDAVNAASESGNMAAEDIVKYLRYYRETPSDPGVGMTLSMAIDEWNAEQMTS